MSSMNPFVEDIETRQVRRSRSSRCFASCVPPFCAFLFGTIGLIVFIYILATLNPLGLDGNISGKRSLQELAPYDVRRPIRRWPVNGNKKSDGLEPYDVSRPIRRRPTITSPNGNSPSVDLEKSSSAEQVIRTVPYSNTPTADPTTDLSTSESVQPYVYVFNRSDPLNDIVYPNVPAPALCIPRMKMNQEEYDEKQFYCYQCWQDVGNGTIRYSTSALSQEEHRYKCHAYCFDNYEFNSCAIHMFSSHPSDSARNCTYCKQATREALGLGERSHL